MLDPPEPDCWLHPDVAVRPSPIAGLGLFAEAARNPQRPYIDTITVDEDVHLVLPPRRPNGYGNHSCDPNLWWVEPYELTDCDLGWGGRTDQLSLGDTR